MLERFLLLLAVAVPFLLLVVLERFLLLLAVAVPFLLLAMLAVAVPFLLLVVLQRSLRKFQALQQKRLWLLSLVDIPRCRLVCAS